MDLPLKSRILLGCVAAIYLLAFPYHPKIRAPNELSRLWQARALAYHHTLELNQTLAEYGRVGDLSVVRWPVLPLQGASPFLLGGADRLGPPVVSLRSSIGLLEPPAAHGSAGLGDAGLAAGIPENLHRGASPGRSAGRDLRAGDDGVVVRGDVH